MKHAKGTPLPVMALVRIEFTSGPSYVKNTKGTPLPVMALVPIEFTSGPSYVNILKGLHCQLFPRFLLNLEVEKVT